MKWFAWELARYYGPALCRAGSDTRVAHLQAELAERVEAIIVNDDPQTYSTIKFLRNAITAERADLKYAEKARIHPVNYHSHLDSGYWKRLTARLRVASGGRCSSCSTATAHLDAHHLGYSQLGFETVRDLVALCRDCHEGIHNITRKEFA
jgi:hypothetical protein